MTASRRIPYNGAELTMRELAKATGIGYICLNGRYRKGDRGEKLWRPLDCVGRNSKGRSPTSFRGEGVNARTREEEAAKREAQLARREERAACIAAMKVALAAELRRPLIDSALLTDAEHAANWDRVKFCGQRCWSLKGLA